MSEDRPRDDWLACVDSPLDVGLASSWVVLPSCGAAVTFQGTVRDHSPGHQGVYLLAYEAYEDHVVPAMERVAAEARSRFPAIGRVVIWHRVGELALSDVAVVIAVSTPHRPEAFDAGRWLIDEVKATVPIWKQEHSESGARWGATG